LGIIGDIERKYGINNYVKPKLKISEDDTLALAAHSRSKNEIIFFKGSLKREIDETVKFLSHKEMETSISDIRYRILQYSI
jgi:hypothetical protein